MSEDSGSMASTTDAREIIEEIARRKGTFTDAFRREAENEARNGRGGMLQAIEAGEEIREDLAKALNIISTDLHTSRTRFLMELIQNADDNKYSESDTPTVSITIFPKYVKIECNENGFSRENIEALCRTGRSSKKPGPGYTGELGIGFKSVFKLAMRAHIRSQPYYFQLDQERELGVITPQWDEDFFDDFEEEYQTTIVLDRIRDQSTDFATVLEKDVDAIDPVLILFLRRIEKLHLTLYMSSLDNMPTISKRFQRVDWKPDSGIVSLQDEDTEAMHHLYKHRLVINFDGTETRRPGITDTEIVLAFPVENKRGMYMPLIQDQNFVFAYLPIGNFGFKFVLQADFITTSSRQSVEEDNYWNVNIVDAIPKVFEAAINKLNFNGGSAELDELTKTWPLYLNNNTDGLSAFWRSIVESINRHLRGAYVIWNRAGNLEKPKRLMFLDWAQDRSGEPIFGYVRNYVSSDYPDSVRDALLSLGVTAPNWSWVCDQLRELHETNLLQTKMRSKEWCSDLAKVILEPQEPIRNRKYARDLREIPLIPLADGTWRCPPSKNEPIYFPASSETSIPPGLSLSLVDEESCACPKTRRLFRLLGVKDCDVPNVIERILDYLAKFSSANPDHLIAQLKYLYMVREHLRPVNMEKIYFVCPDSEHLQRGVSTYADTSVGRELQLLFSGYTGAHFLDSRYFVNLNPVERAKFEEWLSETAGVALGPRLKKTRPDRLHTDFRWLLINKSDQVLPILQKYWSLYKNDITNAVKEELADHEVRCKSGGRARLYKTYIPFPTLVEKTGIFGNAEDCNFLTLPSGDPKDWEFLSSFGVGLVDDLYFYLWVLIQSGFKEHRDVNKSRQLYLAIQERTFSPTDEKKVRSAFIGAFVNLPNGEQKPLKSCVWHGPKGFPSRPALHPVYGGELDRLFREILRIPNATSAEALKVLEHLRNDESTTMADVAEVYMFVQEHHAETFSVDEQTACIAVPPSFMSALEWKTTAQCVWSDDEFSQNDLILESKTAICCIVEQHTPTTKAFFTEILKLPNAGIDEFLADLELMQKNESADLKRVYRLYERIESCSRNCPEKIMDVSTPMVRQLADRFDRKAFREAPIIFFRGMNDQHDQWLSLDDCIWTRSVLRYKHALMPSLNEYRGLFRDTLGVPNVTMDMLITDLLESPIGAPIDESEDLYQYVKELLQEIACLRQNDEELQRLDGKNCWPCHTPTRPRELCSIGSFYVNDRQDFFDIFSGTHTFLDFDFEESRKIAGLLRNRGCDSFLSNKVITETVARELLQREYDLTWDFRVRADALVKYFEHAECKSPYDLRLLLENVDVGLSANIKTHYTLEGITVTRCGGGSSVKVSTGRDNIPKLEIYLSANKRTRDCALINDVPEQLIAALKLESADLPDLRPLLQVQHASLNTLLIRRGITGEIAADDYEETFVTRSMNEDLQSQIDDSSDDNHDDTPATSASSALSDSVGSVVLESAHTSVRSVATSAPLQSHLNTQPSSRPITPETRSQDQLNVLSDESPRERPVTPLLAAAGLYSTNNRNRNMERLQAFARNASLASSSRTARISGQRVGSGDAYDMSILSETLGVAEPTPLSQPVQIDCSSRRRPARFLNRSEVEVARDFEVGFLGELFVYTLLHDTLELPDFTAEDNWTSSLRSRAGFSACSDDLSDFTYKDTQGTLTRHLLQMQHPYPTPEWMRTAYGNGNVPLYRLEVKSTTSRDATTTFYMSGRQYKLAKRLRVISATPPEIYVVLRISGLDALEDGAAHRPEWRVYLDPYTRGEDGVLDFSAPTYYVTATA